MFFQLINFFDEFDCVVHFKLYIFDFENNLIVELFAFIEIIDKKILKSFNKTIKLDFFNVKSIKNSKIQFDEKFNLFNLTTIKLFDRYNIF